MRGNLYISGVIIIPKGSGGGGRPGRSGDGGAELASAETELKTIDAQLTEHNSRVPGESSELEKIMHPEIAAERERLNNAWKAKDAELNAKYKAAREKVQSLKSPERIAKEAAAGEKAIKAMQDREYREARDKVMQTGIYKPRPKREQTAAEKRWQWQMDHPL